MVGAGEVLMLLGAVLMVLGGLGAVRLPDVYSRMHAASKVPTLGLILAVAGGALAAGSNLLAVSLILAPLLALLTSPVGAHLIGRAAHGTDADEVAALEIDEYLAEDPPTSPY